MPGTLKVKFKHTIPVILHADMMEDFKKAIDGEDVGVFFRQIQEDVVEKYRKEKKENPPTKGALVNYITNDTKTFSQNKKKNQTTLDVFSKLEEINKFIKETRDINDLQRMKRNAHVIETVTRTKLIKISKAGGIENV